MKERFLTGVILLFCITFMQAQTIQLSDRAGLKLQVNNDGTFSGVELNGNALPSGSRGGFYSQIPNDTTKVPLTGTATVLTDGKIQFKLSNSLNDSVTVVVTEGAGYIEVSGELKDLTGTDRGLWLGFNLPVNTIGWKWGHKLNSANSIVSSNTPGYTSTDRLVIPIPTVWSSKGGLALAIPPSHPCIFENGADAKGLRIRMAYGLTPKTTNFPSKAPFRFRIYSCDGTWGFRDALAKYYDWYPEYYSIDPKAMKRLDHRVDWTTMNYENSAASKNDVASLAYANLGEWCGYTKITARPQSMTGEDLRDSTNQGYINAIAKCTDILHYGFKGAVNDPKFIEGRAAIANCAAYHADGSWSMEGLDSLSLDITHNVSPYLYKDDAHAKWPIYGDMYLRRPASLNTYASNITFMHWDRLGGRSCKANYREEHYPYSKYPLSFDQDGKICLPILFTNYELFDDYRLKYLQGGMYHEGAGMEVFNQKNTKERFAGQDQLSMFFMAALLQSSWNEDGDKYHDLEFYNFRRIFMGRKSFRIACPSPQDAIKQSWNPYTLIKRALVDATAMGFCSGVTNTYLYKTDHPQYSTVNSLFYTEPHQSMWASYIPASEAIRLAGWEPVTHAISSSPLVAVNRFGRGDTIYMTVWSPAPPATVEIEVDSAGLGLSNNPDFSEMVSNTPISVTKSIKGWKLAIPMELYSTRVIKILRNGTPAGIWTNTMSKDNEVQIYPNPAKSIVNLKSSHEIKTIELSDLSGKILMNILHPQNTIDVSSLQKGMYLLRVSTKKGIFATKITIQ